MLVYINIHTPGYTTARYLTTDVSYATSSPPSTPPVARACTTWQGQEPSSRTRTTTRLRLGLTSCGGDPREELPAGYRRCTYLESDGASYIDTGMTQVNDYVFTAKTKPVLNMRLFGSGTQAPAFYTFMSGNFTTGAPQQAYNNSVLTAPNAFDPNKVQTVVISREGVNIDDKQFAFSKEPAGQFTTPESVKLFGYTGSSGAMTITAGTTIYYYSVIRRNGSKEMELVPCLSPDNTPCMADTVTGTVYTNQGEGTFLWG